VITLMLAAMLVLFLILVLWRPLLGIVLVTSPIWLTAGALTWWRAFTDFLQGFSSW
jgi:hypothetical protein